MPSDYSRIHRLLKILTLIQSEKGWTARRLARECGTTERTIYRDMKMLERAGIPYFYDEQTRGYGVHRDFFLPPVQMALDEALALVAMAQKIAAQEQIPFLRPAARAISKIRGHLPLAIRQELDNIEQQIQIKLAAASPPEGFADVYETMRSALAQRRALRCSYDSVTTGRRDRDGQTFLFMPYTLFFNQRAWYAVGYHSARRAIRCLKLTRFTAITPAEQTYMIPKNFSLQRHLGNAWRMIRGQQTHRVELHFDAEFAETVADTQWHPTQQVIWHADGSITFRCTVDGLDEIVWWVLGMGPHCTVKKPAELAERVRGLAGQIVARYDGHVKAGKS